MKQFLLLALVVFITSCASSHGCNYQKAQKYNARQMRKAHRYYH